MKSYSHWGMFHCWEAPESLDMAGIYEPDYFTAYGSRRSPGLPPMAEQPKSWVHVDIGTPYPVANYTLAEILTPHEDDLKLTITRELK